MQGGRAGGGGLGRRRGRAPPPSVAGRTRDPGRPLSLSLPEAGSRGGHPGSGLGQPRGGQAGGAMAGGAACGGQRAGQPALVPGDLQKRPPGGSAVVSVSCTRVLGRGDVGLACGVVTPVCAQGPGSRMGVAQGDPSGPWTPPTLSSSAGGGRGLCGQVLSCPGCRLAPWGGRTGDQRGVGVS